MESLLADVRACRVCELQLPLGANPILQASPTSRIALIGQAPGTRVHKSGIAWDDPSGKLLRQWMGVSDEEFYDPSHIALVPMGVLLSGKGKVG